MRSDEASVLRFLEHQKEVDIVAPQGLWLDSAGMLKGGIDGRLVAGARRSGVKIMPLVGNQSFDRVIGHRLLAEPGVRKRALQQLAAFCRSVPIYGVQLDLEHILRADRDALTQFVRDAAAALRPEGCVLSVAVVPRGSEDIGPTPHDSSMFREWTGAYDYPNLAAYADFLSVMTYGQHTRETRPGPVAGMPWMERAIRLILAEGVPREKLSLGIPAYSYSWYVDESRNTSVDSGRALSYDAALSALRESRSEFRWDTVQRETVACSEEGDRGGRVIIFMSNARSMAQRFLLAEGYGLRGYSVWAFGLEDAGVWAESRAERRTSNADHRAHTKGYRQRSRVNQTPAGVTCGSG